MTLVIDRKQNSKARPPNNSRPLIDVGSSLNSHPALLPLHTSPPQVPLVEVGPFAFAWGRLPNVDRGLQPNVKSFILFIGEKKHAPVVHHIIPKSGNVFLASRNTCSSRLLLLQILLERCSKAIKLGLGENCTKTCSWCSLQGGNLTCSLLSLPVQTASFPRSTVTHSVWFSSMCS